ncbi:MAG: lysostaphin resistance A-like protein [Pseudomonas sp.]
MKRYLALPTASHNALDDALILLRLAVAYTLLGIFGHYLAAAIMRLAFQHWHIDSQFLLLDALFAGLTLLGSLLLALLLAPARPMRWLFGTGLSPLGIMLAVLFAVSMVLLANPLANWLDIHLPGEALVTELQSQPRAITPLLDLPTPRLLAGLLIAIIWVPLAEEVVFRGWLFRGLLHTRPGVWLALPVTSLIFALMHSFYSPGGILVIGLLGLLLGWLRWRYEQLALCILAHALYNGLTLLLLVLPLP